MADEPRDRAETGFIASPVELSYDVAHTSWEKLRINQVVERKLVLAGTPPRFFVYKTHMRGAWRWHYLVEWKTTLGPWVGLGGWTHTKTAARKAAQELIAENPFSSGEI